MSGGFLTPRPSATPLLYKGGLGDTLARKRGEGKDRRGSIAGKGLDEKEGARTHAS